GKDMNEYVQGLKGDTGADGKSAFEIWKELPGNDGKDMNEYIAGLKGDTGADGKSAFEIWKELPGNDGKDMNEYIAGLKGDTGADGKSAFEIWKELPGNDGKDMNEYVQGLKGDTGADGKSAFEIWKELPGNDGKDMNDYIQGLKGATGATGAKGDTGADGVASLVSVVTTGNTIATYTDKDGNPAKLQETVTTLVDQGIGKHTYTNEKGETTDIDIVQDIADNFPNILFRERPDKGQIVYDAIKNIIAQEQTVTTLTTGQDTLGNDALVYKDEYGNISYVPFSNIVTSETATTLAHNPTSKTLTYTGEKETSIINLKDITTKTSDKVLTVTGTGATFTDATVDIVPSTVEGDVLTTVKDEQGVVNVQWQAPVRNNVMSIQITNTDYEVTPTDYTIIARNLSANITIKLPEAKDNKGRILVINQFNTMKDGVPVVVNFNTPVIYSDDAQYSYIAGSVSGGATNGSAKITLQSDGANWYVITYTM
ncbi:hypothetical protein DMB71_13510, partial [Flavobacterium tistrianum]